MVVPRKLKQAAKETATLQKESSRESIVVDLDSADCPLQACHTCSDRCRAHASGVSALRGSEACGLPSNVEILQLQSHITQPGELKTSEILDDETFIHNKGQSWPKRLQNEHRTSSKMATAEYHLEFESHAKSPIDTPSWRKCWRKKTAEKCHEKLKQVLQNPEPDEVVELLPDSPSCPPKGKGKLSAFSSNRGHAQDADAKCLKEESVPVVLAPVSPDCQFIGSSSFGRATIRRKRSQHGISSRNSHPMKLPRGPLETSSCRQASETVGANQHIIVDDIKEPEVDMELEKLRQIEQDEMLAKHLQEEYFTEDFGLESIDDTQVAQMQDHTENNWRGNNRRLSNVLLSSSPQAAISAMEAVQRQMQWVPPRRAGSVQPPLSRRMRIMQNMQNRSHDRSMQGRHLGRGLAPVFDESILHFHDDLDLDARMEILAMMESVVQGTHPFLEHIDRDFNESDYEMLLALDDHYHEHRGASIQRIEQLPVSVIKPSDVYEETCSICLELPSTDDRVRRLPCMHGFHQQCIDVWLGRHASCPICKVSI